MLPNCMLTTARCFILNEHMYLAQRYCLMTKTSSLALACNGYKRNLNLLWRKFTIYVNLQCKRNPPQHKLPDKNWRSETCFCWTEISSQNMPPRNIQKVVFLIIWGCFFCRGISVICLVRHVYYWDVSVIRLTVVSKLIHRAANTESHIVVYCFSDFDVVHGFA